MHYSILNTSIIFICMIIHYVYVVFSDKFYHIDGSFYFSDIDDLEKKIRRAIVDGQPKTGKPWRKMYVVVEGIYSMDGTIVNLPGIIALKEKYNVSAHQIICLAQLKIWIIIPPRKFKNPPRYLHKSEVDEFIQKRAMFK